MFLFLDNRPGVPSEDVGDPVWTFAVDPVFPLDGDNLVVTCADGTSAKVPVSDRSWLGPSAPTATRPAAPGSGDLQTAATSRPS
ncbi:hypothetical protein [Nostocoides australiense]|nr:hypothetical protein [Actinomycetota bacterium]HPF81117.1 hypothetical protein [Tetrasphaera australiensis]HRW01972.1 hypothetical protein [Tetrasphaera sp.]